MASILVGMGTTLAWEVVGRIRTVDGVPGYLFGLETAYPALALSIGTLVVVSLLTPAQSEEEAAPLLGGTR